MAIPLLAREDGGAFVIARPDGEALITLRLAPWETGFFGRRFGSLELAGDLLAALPPDLREWVVARTAEAADAVGYDLVQVHLDIRFLALAPFLEAAGFRLVESRAEFLTRIDRRHVPRRLPPFGTAEPAVSGDKEALVALAHEGLTANPAFQSRFKDPAYFTTEESSRWFASWVEGDFTDPHTLLAVWRLDGCPVAFFGYALRGEHERIPLYKSTLAVTAPRWQGHKAHMFLQTTLFEAMPTDEFWVRAVTQLGNGPVIHNNIALGRRLHRIALTFFRRPPD